MKMIRYQLRPSFLVVAPELRDCLPPKPQDYLDSLRSSVLASGVLEPLVAWRGCDLLVDGHVRLELARRYGIRCRVELRPFAGMDEAIAYRKMVNG